MLLDQDDDGRRAKADRQNHAKLCEWTRMMFAHQKSSKLAPAPHSNWPTTHLHDTDVMKKIDMDCAKWSLSVINKM